MTITTTHRTALVIVTFTGTLLLGGCTGSVGAAPAATTSPVAAGDNDSASPSPTDSVDILQDATRVAEAYLTAISEEDFAGAFALLTPQAQQLIGSAEQLEQVAFSVVRADEASGYLGGGTIQAGPGPTADTTLVTATNDRQADAWLIRETTDGLLVDDAGVPPTGVAPYEWVTPASGAEDADSAISPLDTTRPAALRFTDVSAETGAAGPSLIGYPATVYAYQGTTPIAATDASGAQQRNFDLSVDPKFLS